MNIFIKFFFSSFLFFLPLVLSTPQLRKIVTFFLAFKHKINLFFFSVKIFLPKFFNRNLIFFIFLRYHRAPFFLCIVFSRKIFLSYVFINDVNTNFQIFFDSLTFHVNSSTFIFYYYYFFYNDLNKLSPFFLFFSY